MSLRGSRDWQLGDVVGGVQLGSGLVEFEREFGGDAGQGGVALTFGGQVLHGLGELLA